MWIFDPPPLGGPQKNNELMVGFFWQRLYAIYGYILPQTPYLEILHTESSSFNIFGTMGALTDVWRLVLTCIITSRVSGRGNIIGPMVVCVCVCLCALSRLIYFTYRQEILHGNLPGPYLGQVGQGHTSKVKVTRWENATLGQFYWSFSDLNGMIKKSGLWCDVVMWCDVTK